LDIKSSRAAAPCYDGNQHSGRLPISPVHASVPKSAACISACISACLAGFLAATPATAAQCGTALFFERANRQGVPAALQSLAKHADDQGRYRARTFVSDNFLLHYSLRDMHRIHLEAADSVLVRLSDSLYRAYSALGTDARDSAVYARLDALRAPHPAYIEKLGGYFEDARAYYVGKLGMKAPSSPVLSVQYQVDPALPPRFPIDVADLGTADPLYAGETYAITYPPPNLSITFENDFLCYTSLDDEGKIQGTHIASRLDGRTIHDYAVEWELGQKVTAFHEFYHAVQFTYNPRVASYHAWYEISATGMEERNAPEVDDYLQYLPCVLRNHDKVSLLSTLSGPCTHYPMYGHAIFHQYLSRALDSSFDVKVWDRLGRNGDKLEDALLTALAQYGKTMPELYSEYAAENFFAGTRFAAPDPAIWSTGGFYSQDFPKWPDIAYDSVDLAGKPYRVITLPPLTYAVLKVKGGGSAPARQLQARVATGIVRIQTGPDSSLVERLVGSATLGAPRAGYQEYYVILPNPSFTVPATFEIKDQDADFYAFPNPVRAASGALSFSQPKDMRFPAQLPIYGEAGKEVRSLEFAAVDVMDWDLRDGTGKAVKPGVYYYRLGTGPLRTLLVLR
jgi:hypothetical protein